MNKSTSQLLHFIKRMEERFNITVTDEILKFIKSQVNSPYVRYEKQSNRVRRYHMNILGHQMIIVYDDQRKCPTTCLYT